MSTDNDALVCELLPCPVCGDKPKWRGSRHDYAAGIYRLQCLGETHLFQAYGASEEKCIAAWNARPPLTPQPKPRDPPAQDEVEPTQEILGRIAYAIIEGSAGVMAADHAREFVTSNWADAVRSARNVITELAAIAALRADEHLKGQP